jgi:hypothetical protein
MRLLLSGIPVGIVGSMSRRNEKISVENIIIYREALLQVPENSTGMSDADFEGVGRVSLQSGDIDSRSDKHIFITNSHWSLENEPTTEDDWPPVVPTMETKEDGTIILRC